MIDHVLLHVRDLEASRKFYEASLLPLGLRVSEPAGDEIAFGEGERDVFRIARRAQTDNGVHIAFRCSSRHAVDRFFIEAMGAGGRDNGSPGLRKIHHATYYAAFVLDPDGNNIEAVCHEPGGG